MSEFPACSKRRKHKAKGPRPHGLAWIASEPYRVFFFSGSVWSIVGVMLWPLFYAQAIPFFPGFAHARIMIEAFGGAFVVGFLGTAGPRMATAPKLTPFELCLLVALHQASAISHLCLRQLWGDLLFVTLLGVLLICLVARVILFRKEMPPPQMVLALTGLICGVAGAGLLTMAGTFIDPQRLRLANLLLYQGLLLPPVLGIGSFVFPRMLGGDFGEPKTTSQIRSKLQRSVAAAVLVVLSFFAEANGQVMAGFVMRAATSFVYLMVEVRWKPEQAGSLTTGLFWALAMGWLGLILAPFHYAQHVSIEHLMYIGGFGMLMLVVGSRVLFGHSGDLEGFFATSKWVRLLVFLGILAATTRATPAWVPSTTVSHHIYAALTWACLAAFWLIWHKRRFVTRDAEE